MSTSADEAPSQGRSPLQIAFISITGTSIEWYDFFLYAIAAALIFPAAFFPSQEPLTGTLLSFGTFTVAFIARPFGAIIFGHFGDKVGRKGTLVTAMSLMGVATAAIGLLPTYGSIGIAAPVLLVVLRILQGLALGGQWGGAMLIATENAPRNKRGLYGSFAQIGNPVGLSAANGLFLIFSSVLAPEQLQAWGWRIPFLLSLLLIGVAIYAQTQLEETSAFKQVKETHTETRLPIVSLLRTYPRQIMLATGAIICASTVAFIMVAYILSYGAQVLDIATPTLLLIVTLAALTWIPELLFFAALSDRLGRRKVFLAGAALLGLWAFPLFWLIDTGSPMLIFLGIVVGSVFHNMMYGPQAALTSELFGTRVRYSGASLGYQLAVMLGGGLAPTIATALFAITGTSASISAYMVVVCLISVVSIFLIAETYRVDIEEMGEPESLDQKSLTQEHKSTESAE